MSPETINSGQISPAPAQAIEPPKKCKHTSVIIILAILAIGGLGFGVYGMTCSDDTTLNSQQSDITNEQELSVYESRDLKNKTLRLLGYRSGFSNQKNSADGFMTDSDYMPISELIKNQMDDSLKVYVALETTTLGKEKNCNYRWTNGVKADIDNALANLEAELGHDTFDCVSYDEVNDDYYDLWGEAMPKLNSFKNQNSYGDFAYGSNLDAYYYHILGGRGGICTNGIAGKISQIGKEQDYSYVDIKAGSFAVCADSPLIIYSGIEKQETHKTLENVNWDGNLKLETEDYEAFHSYRFTFKKNPGGFYSFSTVEKIQ